jgi:phospholipid/cholesterol/gamma-HCH transport system substrate-binding protein
MNERVMQFRIGMFVLGAGLVLTMLIVWFGESPSLFRDTSYVSVHFVIAPGVSEGIPVRKSGIRIGEVTSIRFDDRPRVRATVQTVEESRLLVQLNGGAQALLPLDQLIGRPPEPGSALDVVVTRPGRESDPALVATPDGVLVLLSLERRYRLTAGSTPRITRGLIGDVSIDILPGDGPGLLETSENAAAAPIVEGQVAPDPANALAAATDAFGNVKGTLTAIEEAARGLSAVTKKIGNLDEVTGSFRDASDKVGTLAENVDRVIRTNESEIAPTLTSLRKAADNIGSTLDEPTRKQISETVSKLTNASDRIDRMLAEMEPVAKDLAADPSRSPSTNMGQLLLRANRIAYDLSLVTRAFGDGKGGLNENGTLQRLITSAEVYDNISELTATGKALMKSMSPVVRNLGEFSRKVAADPSLIGRGALRQ